MAKFCLTNEQIDSFKKALKEKEIKIQDLIKMDTESRIKLLEKYAGKDAANVNMLIEEKLVLKNKILGIKNAIEKIAQINKYSPSERARLANLAEEYKMMKLKRMLSPEGDDKILSGLIEKKFGFKVTPEEGKMLFDLTSKTEKLKTEAIKTGTKENYLKYATSKVMLENYVDSLKNPKFNLKEHFVGLTNEIKELAKDSPMKATQKIVLETVRFINDTLIELATTLDNSFAFLQGAWTLRTHPSAWVPAVKKSFKTIFDSLIKKHGAAKSWDIIRADFYSRENFVNGLYEKAGIVTKKMEEEIPRGILAQIPYLGRVFKASNLAFQGSALRMRADLFDLLLKQQIKLGNKIDDALIEDLGKIVLSSTGRGKGKISSNEIVRLFVWAPRLMKSALDRLTAHGFGVGLKTKAARKIAYTNLAKYVAETIGLAVVLDRLFPGSIEPDPTSSDFGRFRQGKVRISYMSGLESYIILAARIATMSVKKVSGEKIKLNEDKYGAKTVFDIGIDFLTNKFTPLARSIYHFTTGLDENFEKTTIKGELSNSLPISIQNFLELRYDKSQLAILGAFLNIFGINSYLIHQRKKPTKTKSKSMNLEPIKLEPIKLEPIKLKK